MSTANGCFIRLRILDQVFNVSIGRRVAPKDPAESDHIFKVEVTRMDRDRIRET